MSRSFIASLLRCAACSALVLGSGRAAALDKQGSAHGGSLEGRDEGFDVSGSAFLGTALYNPTYAARPDNTGLALLRVGAHADIDLIGRRLSIPLDINMFTDATRRGLGVLVPSELDFIGGVTSTWRAGPGAIELGTRAEHDRPVDRGGLTQSYVDARARYLFSGAALSSALQGALAGGDVTGWLTFGGFVFNPTYAARPDNTGLALLRYAAHVEVSVWDKHLGVALDTTFFSDRLARNPIAPSEIDVTPELIGRLWRLELHVAYERDMPLDRGGLVQEIVYTLVGFSFDEADAE